MSNTTLTRAWPQTLFFVALALGLGYWAFDLFRSGSYWGIAPAFFGLAFLGAAAMARKAGCPHCGAVIEAGPVVTRCTVCGDYAHGQQGRLVPVPRGFVLEEADFKMDVAELFRSRGAVEQWRWPSPEACCVCGSAATKLEDVKMSLSGGTEMLGTMERIVTYTFRVPHCAAHSKGVTFDYVALKFRAYDYWREFRAANRE